ncbi:MAG: tRNA epoxyqueuosine(34) reductase QueG [Bacteroidetes bacterium]|nr:tRNA epoxyqueuosine(34) reductase QueG [Bacteroidota bacterium]MCL2302449.1 tRNA epoxyqueuosine(34) reductase QueG [Lentimicrobiaceae bacterium]
MKIQSEIIKQIAHNCGFSLCGIAKSEPLTIEKERFEKALAQNFHAKKPYLERDIDKRFHPELLLENCKSVIVCGFNYNMRDAVCDTRCAVCGVRCATVGAQNLVPSKTDTRKISQYAQIKDYHVFMKEKMEKLAQRLQEEYGAFNYKTTIDSSAISEKAWAVQTGIGYYGKNGIIQTSVGSFIFLGTLLIDKEVDEYDAPNQNSCKNCSKCIAACPTNAIVDPYYVDCNQCITHITLNKNETDFTRVAKYGWLIACDVCQNVCPNNANAPINEEAMARQVSFLENKDEIFDTLTPESFEDNFKSTILYQFKYEGLKKRLEDFKE